MSAAILRAWFSIGDRRFTLNVPICGDVIQEIVAEIISFLNYHGTQKAFGIHSPSPEQLAEHYVASGGLGRCINKGQRPMATIAL